MRGVIHKRFICKMIIAIMGVVFGMQVICVADASGIETEETYIIDVHTKAEDTIKNTTEFFTETEESENNKAELEESIENEKEIYNDKIGTDLREFMEYADDHELIHTAIYLEKVEDDVLDEILAGIDNYEQRLDLIYELYWKDAGAIVEKYFPLDENERVDKWYIQEGILGVYVTKAEIKQLAEETTIRYLSGLFVESGFSDESSQIILIEAKAAARAHLRGYKDFSLYRPEQQAELALILENGISDVKHAKDTYFVRRAVQQAEKEMDAVKTHQQLLEEENGNIGNQGGNGSGNINTGNQGGNGSGNTNTGNQGGNGSGNINTGNQGGNGSGNINIGSQDGNGSGETGTSDQGNHGTGNTNSDNKNRLESENTDKGIHGADHIEENDIESQEYVDTRKDSSDEVRVDEAETEMDFQKNDEEAEGENERHKTDVIWKFVVVGILLFWVLIILRVRHMKKHKE